MRHTELIADAADSRLWVLPGVGTLRRTGRISRAATAEAGGRSWAIRRHGIARTGFTATDQAGVVVGRQQDSLRRSSDTLLWDGRDLTLRRDEPDRAGHVLRDGERRLALMTPKRSGKRPLDVVIEDPQVDPGLLLFMGFIVQASADDASFPPPVPGTSG